MSVNSRILRAVFAIGFVLSLAACESREARRIRAGDDPDGARLEVSFWEQYSRKHDRRSGRTDEFTIADEARVRAFADFENLRAGRDYTVHLVWIGPDGREIFRKFGEFRWGGRPGAYTGRLQWKDAEDLHDIRVEELAGEEPALSLYSSFSLDPDRERETGRYAFRVYLDRRLLAEEHFTVRPARS